MSGCNMQYFEWPQGKCFGFCTYINKESLISNLDWAVLVLPHAVESVFRHEELKSHIYPHEYFMFTLFVKLCQMRHGKYFIYCSNFIINVRDT